MELNFIDKMLYLKNYIVDIINSKIFSYNAIISDGEKNNKLKFMMNLYNIGICSNSHFREKKVVLKYCGKRKFIIGFNTTSHWNINNKITNICENFNFENKIKHKFPNFIENVFLVKNNGKKHNIIEELNECIMYDDNTIKFGDIAKICGIKNVRYVEIEYVKKFKKYVKNIDYFEYENKDVGILNEIFDENTE